MNETTKAQVEALAWKLHYHIDSAAWSKVRAERLTALGLETQAHVERSIARLNQDCAEDLAEALSALGHELANDNDLERWITDRIERAVDRFRTE